LTPADAVTTEVRALIASDGFLRCFPHIHDTDGFFAARFERRK
jgi:16S rRNA C967 or C1407 C5-methylase (RsmB/RsmF family)